MSSCIACDSGPMADHWMFCPWCGANQGSTPKKSTRMCAYDKDRPCDISCAAYDDQLLYPQAVLKLDEYTKEYEFVFGGTPKFVPFCHRFERPVKPGLHSTSTTDTIKAEPADGFQ